MEAAERKKLGRRAFEPSEADRATVRRMARARHADIARVIGVSVPTLRKAFAAELAARHDDDLFSPETAPRIRTLSPDRDRGGRKPFQPNDAQRRRVMELAAAGKPVSSIARILDVSEPTLRKHFAEELETGADRIEAQVIEQLMAAVRRGNVAAMREARAIITQARLDRIDAALSAPSTAKRPETPGKKLEAANRAAELVATAPHLAHLRPN